MRVLSFFTILLIFLANNSAASAEENFCPALLDAKTYKSKQSYKYLLQGEEGWLFRSRKDFKADFVFSENTINKFKQLHDAMLAKETRLHIVMPPTRGHYHAQHLKKDQPQASQFDQEKARQSYLESIEQLQSAGISVASFDQAFNEENFYYKRDHHWTLAGAKYSAKQTAALFKSYKNSLNKVSYQTEITNEKKELEGSFEKFVEKQCSISIPGETTAIVKTYKEDDLFTEEEQSADIALIGTSNCTEPNPSYANFAGYLREFIGADVDNLSIAGGGIDTPILHFLASDVYQQGKYKHVIWELASHYDFNGKEFEPYFQQMIPAARGACAGKELLKKDISIEGEKTFLHSEDIPSSSYVYLDFNQPVKEDFALVYKNKEGKSKRFRFKRSGRYPHDGQYFLDWDSNDDAIASIALLKPKSFDAESVSVSICLIDQ